MSYSPLTNFVLDVDLLASGLSVAAPSAAPGTLSPTLIDKTGSTWEVSAGGVTSITGGSGGTNSNLNSTRNITIGGGGTGFLGTVQTDGTGAYLWGTLAMTNMGGGYTAGQTLTISGTVIAPTMPTYTVSGKTIRANISGLLTNVLVRAATTASQGVYFEFWETQTGDTPALTCYAANESTSLNGYQIQIQNGLVRVVKVAAGVSTILTAKQGGGTQTASFSFNTTNNGSGLAAAIAAGNMGGTTSAATLVLGKLYKAWLYCENLGDSTLTFSWLITDSAGNQIAMHDDIANAPVDATYIASIGDYGVSGIKSQYQYIKCLRDGSAIGVSPSSLAAGLTGQSVVCTNNGTVAWTTNPLTTNLGTITSQVVSGGGFIVTLTMNTGSVAGTATLSDAANNARGLLSITGTTVGTVSLVYNSPTSVTASWPAATGGTGPYTYGVGRASTPTGAVTPLVSGQSPTSYTYSPAVAGTGNNKVFYLVANALDSGGIAGSSAYTPVILPSLPMTRNILFITNSQGGGVGATDEALTMPQSVCRMLTQIYGQQHAFTPLPAAPINWAAYYIGKTIDDWLSGGASWTGVVAPISAGTWLTTDVIIMLGTNEAQTVNLMSAATFQTKLALLCTQLIAQGAQNIYLSGQWPVVQAGIAANAAGLKWSAASNALILAYSQTSIPGVIAAFSGGRVRPCATNLYDLFSPPANVTAWLTSDQTHENNYGYQVVSAQNAIGYAASATLIPPTTNFGNGFAG